MDNRMDELLARICELETENKNLKKWQSMVNELLQKMMDILAQGNEAARTNDEISRLWEYVRINRYRIDSLPYEMMDPDYKSFYYKPHILSKSETIRQIVEEHKSIARLGDGEFAAIVGQKRWNFQGVSELLSARLQDVLKSEASGLLIGLHPTFYMNLFALPEADADAVRAYMRPMVRQLHADLLDPDKVYGDALFHGIKTEDDLKNLKKIWANRDCIFIEGIYTRMGIGNDLFDNCQSIERILCPAENAIDKYDAIMNAALKQPKNKLVLLALGPTATVLAHDLFKEGYQAVDIGHIDLIYESFLRNTHDFNYVNIPYKYCKVNEWKEGLAIEDINDPVYNSQIVMNVQ